MKSIWKFQFDTSDSVKINMPAGAKVLAVQVQNDKPCLWAMVDTEAPMRERSFTVYGTGHPVHTYGPDQTPYGKYVGTYQQSNGTLVFHLFERGGPQ